MFALVSSDEETFVVIAIHEDEEVLRFVEQACQSICCEWQDLWDEWCSGGIDEGVLEEFKRRSPLHFEISRLPGGLWVTKLPRLQDTIFASVLTDGHK